MFDVSIIKSSLSNIVGFRQPTNSKYAILDASNLISQSGLYITDNPYAKIEYIKDNIDDAKISNADFNTHLKNLKETSIINVCSQVFNEPDFLDRNLIYTNTNNKSETFQLPNGFSGYEIKLSKEKSIAIKLNRAILEFTQSGTKDLLIFNSNLKDPVHTITINHTDYYHQEDIDIMLNDLGFYKGTFYIGFINDGSQETYKRSFDSSNIKNHLTYIDIDSIKVDNHVSSELFNLNSISRVSDYCGFNLDITVVEDYTDFVLNNKYLFSRAIYLDSIIACLSTYAASLRSNRNERSAEELYSRIMVEIEGTRPDDNVISIKGLRPEMIYEISQIKEQLDKLKQGFKGFGYFVDTQE